MPFHTSRRLIDVAELRHLSAVSIVLFPVRIFLGFGWLRAGIEKAIDTRWWSGDYLRAFLAEQESAALPLMVGLVDHVFEPFAEVVALIVLVLQLLVGVCFITGRRMQHALRAAIAMNIVFVAMGALDPSVFYLVIELALLAAVGLGVFGGRPTRPNVIVVGAMLGAAAGLVPLVTTLHPAEVIDDPALILITVAALGAATESLRWFVRPQVAERGVGPAGPFVSMPTVPISLGSSNGIT